MTIAATQAKTYTAEEYLALEVESDTRSEFRIRDTTGVRSLLTIAQLIRFKSIC
ncbi:MAG: hypothetical protein AAF921_26460 [Cyanobacteria bacterium P01_D01_bin.44]